MSTKQALTVAALIVFLATSMVTLGLWFNSSFELEAKTQPIKILTDKQVDLNLLVNGSSSKPGLKGMIEEPSTGLKDQYAAAVKRTHDMAGDATHRPARAPGA